MPTYEYTCTKCAHSWDAFHSVADRDTPLSGKCAKCFVVNMISIDSFYGHNIVMNIICQIKDCTQYN